MSASHHDAPAVRPAIVHLDDPEMCKLVLGFPPRHLKELCFEAGCPVRESKSGLRAYVIVDEFTHWFKTTYPLRPMRGEEPLRPKRETPITRKNRKGDQ